LDDEADLLDKIIEVVDRLGCDIDMENELRDDAKLMDLIIR
jgi:hypothetical protein